MTETVEHHEQDTLGVPVAQPSGEEVGDSMDGCRPLGGARQQGAVATPKPREERRVERCPHAPRVVAKLLRRRRSESSHVTPPRRYVTPASEIGRWLAWYVGKELPRSLLARRVSHPDVRPDSH